MVVVKRSPKPNGGI